MYQSVVSDLECDKFRTEGQKFGDSQTDLLSNNKVKHSIEIYFFGLRPKCSLKPPVVHYPKNDGTEKLIWNVCCHMLSTTDKCWQPRTRFQVLKFECRTSVSVIFPWPTWMCLKPHIVEEENVEWAWQDEFYVRDVSHSWCRNNMIQLLLWVLLSNVSMSF